MLLRLLVLVLAVSLCYVSAQTVLNMNNIKDLDPKKVADMIMEQAREANAERMRGDDDDDDDDDDDEPAKPPPKKKEAKKKASGKKATKKKAEKDPKKKKAPKKEAKKAKPVKEAAPVEPEPVVPAPVEMEPEVPVVADMEPEVPVPADKVEGEKPAFTVDGVDPGEAFGDLDAADLEGETDPNVIAHKMGQKHMKENARPGEQIITYSPPLLNDEEQHSTFMPFEMKCDACISVTFQLYDSFEKYNEIHKWRKYDVPESEVLELTEKACEGKTYENYGIKTIEGVKRLSGPGLDHADTPGVTAGGGKWPNRLRDMCETFMGEVGEVAIYSIYKKNPRSRRRLEDYLCRGKGVRSECQRKKAPSKDEL